MLLLLLLLLLLVLLLLLLYIIIIVIIIIVISIIIIVIIIIIIIVILYIMVYTPFESIREQTHVVIVNCSVHLSPESIQVAQREPAGSSGWVGWMMVDGSSLGRLIYPGIN